MELEELKKEALESVDKIITPKAKGEAIAFLKDNALPKLSSFADGLISGVKNSAAGKSGWCYFRDMYFLPCTVNLIIWALGKLLDRMEAATAKEIAAEETAAAAETADTTVTAETGTQEGSDAPAAQPGQA